MIAILALVAWSLASWLPAHRGDSIDVYSFAQYAKNESIPLHKIEQDFSFPLLFIDQATDPFSFDLSFGNHAIRGKRSCWIVAGQAKNYGQLIFSSNKSIIGTLNNKLNDFSTGSDLLS